MRRSSSSWSLRRASSPLISAPSPPLRRPLRRTTSTPSMCFQSWSLSEVPPSPAGSPTPPLRQRDIPTRFSETDKRVAEVSRSSSREEGCAGWEPDLLSRSTQTELLAENSTQTDLPSFPKDDDLLVDEESGFPVRRFLGVEWNRSFLLSLAMLSAVAFTIAAIATLSGTSNANKKIDSLDIAPDGFESEQASAHKDVMVTAASTTRKATTVRRMRAAGKVRSSKKEVIKARKKASLSHRKPKNRPKEHRTPLPTTTRPPTRKQAKIQRRPRTVLKARGKTAYPRPSRRHGAHNLSVKNEKKVSGSRRTSKGHPRLVTRRDRTTTTTISNADEESADNGLAQESEEPQESSLAPP